MEYIYLHDKVWKNKPDSKEEPVEIGIIVTDVVRDGPNGYFFTIKETNERKVCHYAWAFAENTPSNAERVRDYFIAKDEWLRADRERSKAFLNVITLERTQAEIRTIKLNELNHE